MAFIKQLLTAVTSFYGRKALYFWFKKWILTFISVCQFISHPSQNINFHYLLSKIPLLFPITNLMITVHFPIFFLPRIVLILYFHIFSEPLFLIFAWYTVEPRSIVFQGDGENKRWMRENDQSGKLLNITHYVVRSSS